MNFLYQVQAYCTTNNIAFVGIAINSTTTPVVPYGLIVSEEATVHAAGAIEPQLGLSYAQAVEQSSGGTGTTFFGGGSMALQVSLEM